jgi:serine phosphatase RsbU (regulator of sigma subunit)
MFGSRWEPTPVSVMQTETYPATEEPTRQRITPKVRQEPIPQPLSVLLIEDNPGDARLIQFMIRDAGSNLFEIEHVERLAHAFERLDSGGIALVLSDLSLPDSQGLDTFTQLHARAPHVPIIVLSGLNDTSLAVQAVHEGAQDYLIKGQVAGQLLVRAMHYAIERKRMTEQLAHYADELRLKNAELEADFNMAREIQQIFLPHEFPLFPTAANPSRSALRFSQRYLPAAAVGGDFFDIFAINEHVAGIFICDVMGHGMRAALVTAILRGVVEKLEPAGNDPGEFLTELNRSLYAILRRTQEPFPATAFYLVADARDNSIRFANAGHPSPFRVRRDGGITESLKTYDGRHGPALGLFGKSVYPTCLCPANEGDLFFLFTDGIYEVENETHEEYGQQRLLSAVTRRFSLPGDELFDELLKEVRDFSHSPEFPDDVCLVGMEIQRDGT